MKTRLLIHLIALAMLFGFSTDLIGRDAPITTAGSATICPGSLVTVPVTTNAFSQVTSISLRFDYNPQLMNYSSFANANAGLSGIIVNRIIVSSSLHKIMVSWSNINPVSLTDGTKLLDLNFVHISGDPVLTLNNTSNSGGDCEFADESGDPMNDMPTATYYHDSYITNNAVGAAGTISGLAVLCQGQENVVYTVPAITNATDYTWTVPAGATIISGLNTPSITVNYGISASSGNVSVNGSNLCMSGNPSVLPVTVNPVPYPAITGPVQVCIPASNSTYVTQSGQSNYQWSLSAGGTVVSGSNTNTVLVVWNSSGAQTVGVNYSTAAGCQAITPGLLGVALNNKPVPTISGPGSVTAGAQVIIYTTQAGMIGYVWNVAQGGTITGGAGTNMITVLWEATGNMTVSVNYTNQAGCTANNPGVLPVTVVARNAPSTLAESSSICPQGTIAVPLKVSGFNDVSAISLRIDYDPSKMTFGGFVNVNPALEGYEINEITVSASIHKILISWSNIIPATLSDNSTLLTLNFAHVTGSPVLAFNNIASGGLECEYADAYGNPMNDAPTGTYYTDALITNIGAGNAGSVVYSGISPVCQGQNGLVYQTAAILNASTYTWSLPTGGSIISGGNTNAITVSYSNAAISGNVTVSGSNGCGSGAASPPLPVSINPLPGAASPITGLVQVQQNQANVAYSVAAISNATGYSWMLPVGATLTSGANTNSVQVNFGTTAISGNISVYGTNGCGSGTAATLAVSVGFQITGHFSYNNTSETPLDSLVLELRSGGVLKDTAHTTLSGFYRFKGVPPGIYKIGASTGKPWEGVNATDAIKIQRHFAGIEYFTVPVRLLAADVNGSTSINSTDATKVKRRFSGLDTTFVAGNWAFAKTNMEGDTLNVTVTDIVRNYYGLCTGDVNGSHTPNPGDFSNAGVQMVSEGVIEVDPGQEFDLPINARQDMKLGAFSLVLPVPADLFDVMDISVNHGAAIFSYTEGEIRLAWSELEPMELNNGDILCTLKLKTKETFTGNQTFDLSPTYESEMADEAGVPLLLPELSANTIKSREASGISTIDAVLEKCRIFPNPAVEMLHIDLELRKDASVTIAFYDLPGKEVLSQMIGKVSKGNTSHAVNTSSLENGAYVMKLLVKSNDGPKEYLFKVVINK